MDMGANCQGSASPFEDAPHGQSWRITYVKSTGSGRYLLALEGDEGSPASAILLVCNRASPGTHEPADWSVRVEWCDDRGARAWLMADEHEYTIGALCVAGWAP